MSGNRFLRFIITWRAPAAAAAFFALFSAVSLNMYEVNPEEVALLEGTLVKRNTHINGSPMRNDVYPQPEEWDYWRELLPRGTDGLIVWMGNSHLHAVNGMKEGDEVSSYYLHELLNGGKWPGRAPCFGLSYPNLTFAEQFLLTLLLTLDQSLPRPLIFVHGFRYHETRFAGVRSGLKPVLEDPSVKKWIESNGELAGKFPEAFKSLDSEYRAIKELEKERNFEGFLRKRAGGAIPVFKDRKTISAHLALMMRNLRDFAFGIRTSDKRKALSSRYGVSMEFMELTAYVCERYGAKMLMYNVPLRPGKESPYPEADYDRYMEEMESIARKYPRGIVYADYEDAIPEPAWGVFYSTGMKDFSHFKAEGHRILAEKATGDLRKAGFLEF
ncbi:MAG: hypothetical protein AB1742_14895 [bacterium]